MILDLHSHSDASEDSRAPVETYLKWLTRKRDVLPIDGIVLTEHRQWNPTADYRRLEDQYGVLILRGAEVETDYGHMLIYGVTDDMTRRFDFANVRLPAQEVVTGVQQLGGIAVPCHPGRPNVGLFAHYDARGPVPGVRIVETLNGGSRAGENERSRAQAERHGYRGIGGSDAHIVSHVGRCATRFDDPIRSEGDLVAALRAGRFEAIAWPSTSRG